MSSDQEDSLISDRVRLGDHKVSPSGENADAFSERLRLVGERLGAHSDGQLAKLLGFSKAAVLNWRRGINRPYRATLVQIAERTGARLEWLETGEGEMLHALSPPIPPGRSSQAGGRLDVPAGQTDFAHHAAPPGQARAQDFFDIADLVVAYEAALNYFAARGVTAPEPRKLLALTLALYDAAMQAVQEDEAPSAAPVARSAP